MHFVDGEPGLIAKIIWWFWNKIHPEPIEDNPIKQAEYRALMESKGFHFEEADQDA